MSGADGRNASRRARADVAGVWHRAVALLLLTTLAGATPGSGQGGAVAVPKLPAILEVVNGRAEVVTYRGVRAIKLTATPGAVGQDVDMLALLDGADFGDGTIELQVAGAPLPSADSSFRGFIGVSARTGPHGAWSEVFYLRPTNGRSDDQLRRNHSVQYASDPEYPWHRLRAEHPGVYESYADLEPGVWTTMRLEVDGNRARLFINGAAQPTLVVNDLKRGRSQGRIALWAHVQTEAYFGPITVIPR
ncbi:MAG: hypothetical protein V9E87_04410 [Gemmatimonadales bacterium]